MLVKNIILTNICNNNFLLTLSNRHMYLYINAMGGHGKNSYIYLENAFRHISHISLFSPSTFYYQ